MNHLSSEITDKIFESNTINYKQRIRIYTVCRPIAFQCFTSSIALHLTLNISETVRDGGLVPKDHQ